MKLPFPNSKAVWASAIILTGWLYVVYYIICYPLLFHSYKEQFYLVSFACKDNGCVTSKIKTTLITPKYLSNAEIQMIYAKIDNQSADHIRGKIALVVDEQGVDDARKLPLILNNSNIENNLTTDGVNFVLRPHATILIKIPFILEGKSLDIQTMYLYFETDNVREELRPDTFYNGIEISPLNSSFSALLNTVMLPPIANGVIPAFGLFSCWLIETKSYKSKKSNRKDSPASESVEVELDKITIFSKAGMNAIGYFFVLGNVFSIPIMVLFILAGFLEAPSLLIAALPVAFGLWNIDNEKINSLLNLLVAKLNNVCALAILILILDIYSIWESIKSFIGKYGELNMMDGNDQVTFFLKIVLLVIIYVFFAVIALVLIRLCKRNNPRLYLLKTDPDPSALSPNETSKRKKTSHPRKDSSEVAENGRDVAGNNAIKPLDVKSDDERMASTEKQADSLLINDTAIVDHGNKILAEPNSVPYTADSILNRLYECVNCNNNFFSLDLPQQCPSCKENKGFDLVYRCVVCKHQFSSPAHPEKCPNCNKSSEFEIITK